MGNIKQTQSDSAKNSKQKGWYSRGYMPHFDSHCLTQHVTFRLADSLSAQVLAQLEEEMRTVPWERRDLERSKRIEAWIDAGHGSCLLADPAAARIMQDALLQFDGERYRLFAWVVMPNHVHALFQLMEGWPLARVVGSWKSFTGRRLSSWLPESSGLAVRQRVWFREYWDRFIRDEKHFHAVRLYIHNNPVKAGMVRSPQEWEWSSARRELGPLGETLAID